MTYYGRWTYKYEKAAELGAAGCLIVHETGPAGIRGKWCATAGAASLSISWRRTRTCIARPWKGWITHEQAQVLFRAAGLDYEARRKKR